MCYNCPTGKLHVDPRIDNPVNLDAGGSIDPHIVVDVCGNIEPNNLGSISTQINIGMIPS
jgi:hypothetical protein